MLKVIHYRIATPSVLDFQRVYLRLVLDIGHFGNTSLTDAERLDQP